MTPAMSVSEWIARVDEIRRDDPLLARGYWHGYLADSRADRTPMRGEFYLVRWEQPTVAVSHDDPDVVLALARRLEQAVSTALDADRTLR